MPGLVKQVEETRTEVGCTLPSELTAQWEDTGPSPEVRERNILLELYVQNTGGQKEEVEGGAVIREGRARLYSLEFQT